MVGSMDTGNFWLPALLNDNYEMAYHQFAQATGPLKTTMAATGYWIDTRDIFLNGDQFVNYAQSGVVGFPALPTNAAQRRYAASADIDALFNAASPANKVYADGVLNLTIAGQQRKTQSGTQL